MKLCKFAIIAVSLFFCHCAGIESSSDTPAAADNATNQNQSLSAKSSQGRISIMEHGKPIAFIIPASSKIEETKFINGQQQIVVKSRGSHGPATLQLFDSRSGRQEGKIMAFEIQNDQPAWAAGMGE